MKTNKLYLILLLFIFSFQCIRGQEIDQLADSIINSLDLKSLGKDSLRIDRMIDASLDISDSDHYLAKAIMLRALEKAEEVNSDWGMSQANYMMGSFYAQEGMDSLTRDAYEKSIPYMEKTGNKVRLISTKFNLLNLDYEGGWYHKVITGTDSILQVATELNKPYLVAVFRELKGLAHMGLNENLLAINEFLLGVKYFEEEGNDSSRLASLYNSLALSQIQIDKYEEAEEYLRKGLTIRKNRDEKYFIAGDMNHLGDLFIRLDKLDSAQYYYEQSLLINEENQFRILSITYAGLADVYARQKKFEKAKYYYEQAINSYKEHEDLRSLLDIQANWAFTLMDYGRDKAALQVLLEAKQHVEDLGYEDAIEHIFHPLAVVYGFLKEWKLSAEYWEKFAKSTKKRYETESVRQQNELYIAYETEKKEKELLLEQQKNERLQHEARIQELRLTGIWIGSALLLGIMILIFVIYRQRTMRQLLLEEKERKVLKQELEFKQRELTTHTLHLVSKNKLLNKLKVSIESLKEQQEDKVPFRTLIGSIDQDLKGDEDWLHFEKYFKQVYSGFDEKIKQAFVNLTGNEIRLLTLMKMNLSSKEIASILNITPESVNKARYRLRKKINLPSDKNLQQFVLAL